MKDHGVLIICVVAAVLLLFVVPWILSKFIFVAIGGVLGWFAKGSFLALRERFP